MVDYNGVPISELYSDRDVDGNYYETEEAILNRIASIDESVITVHEIKEGMLVPSSAIWKGAGKQGKLLMEDNVLGIEDNLESIYAALGTSAMVQKAGGRVGFNFSELRRESAPVAGRSKVASGPLSFIKLFNDSKDVVTGKEGNEGTSLGVLNVSHPDFNKFLECPTLSNFELFAELDMEAIKAVGEGGDPYPLIEPETGIVQGYGDSSKLLSQLAGRVMEGSPMGILNRVATNSGNLHLRELRVISPKNHIPLLPDESCPTATLNLLHAVKRGTTEIDYEYLKLAVDRCVIFLNRAILDNEYTNPECERITLGYRKIGLGIMGFADLLYLKELPYGGEESVALLAEILQIVRKAAQDSSVKHLNWVKEGTDALDDNLHMKGVVLERAEFFNKSGVRLEKMYNYQLLSLNEDEDVAAVGGVSAGIAPNKSLLQVVRGMDWSRTRVNPVFLAYVEKEVGLTEIEIIRSIKEYGSLQAIPWVTKKMKRIFLVAEDISPETRLDMAIEANKYVDGGVVTNVPVPASYSKDKIVALYTKAILGDLKTAVFSKVKEEEVIPPKEV